MQYLIIGLGNLGIKYNKNRHNVGFLAVDFILNLMNSYGYSFKNQHQSMVIKLNINSHEFIFAKPKTFMNLSGTSALLLSRFYKIPPSNIIIIHDDIDLNFGCVKLKFSGGNAGHNGLRDIDQKIGNNYYRIRVGVGRPKNINQSIADYVLSDFTEEEQKLLNNEIFKKVFDFVNIVVNEHK